MMQTFIYTSSADDFADSVNIGQSKSWIQGQCQHPFRNMLGDRRFAAAVSVTLTVICERIEIFSGENIMFRKFAENLIPIMTESVKDNREISVVGYNTVLDGT